MSSGPLSFSKQIGVWGPADKGSVLVSPSLPSVENSGSGARDRIFLSNKAQSPRAWKQNWGFRVIEGQPLVCLVDQFDLKWKAKTWNLPQKCGQEQG